MLMIFGVFKYAAYVTGNLGLHFHMMGFAFVNAEEEKIWKGMAFVYFRYSKICVRVHAKGNREKCRSGSQ